MYIYSYCNFRVVDCIVTDSLLLPVLIQTAKLLGAGGESGSGGLMGLGQMPDWQNQIRSWMTRF